MITVYDSVTRSLTRGDPAAASWVDVVAPTEAEARTVRELGVPSELFTDALDAHELARVEHHPSGARLFVLRAPVSATADAAVVPIGVVTLANGTIVTISATDTTIPEKLAQAHVDPSRAVRFALLLAERVADRFVKTLEAIEHDVRRLEHKLRASLENDEIMALLDHQKHLVLLDVALQTNTLVLERALDDARLGLTEDDRTLVGDVLVELRQAGVMTRTKKALLGETMDALATVVSNNLNVAMKQIAALTLLVAVPALFAGIFGMNVPLPFMTRGWALYGVLGLSAAVTTGLALVLRRRRWL